MARDRQDGGTGIKRRLHDRKKVKERETFIKENYAIMKGTEMGKKFNISRARVSQIVKKLGLTGLLFLPLLINAQDTSYVEIGEGSNIFYRIVTPLDTDTVFTNEILIAQSNSGSAVIKKKVKWVVMRVTGTGLTDWHYVDNYGIKVDVIKWKNPKNNRWIDP